jgi:diguanylate cyclase (GGDEF)-like protein/hemerythrin-like metal-binding protein
MGELTKKNEFLEKISNTDELTGVFNRHFLEQTVISEMVRQNRYQEPLSMIMIDLDHFKKINDTYGHDIGDLVLLEVSCRIKKAIRDTDYLFRWGGEEFLILVPHTDLDGARNLAEKVRQTLISAPIATVGIVTGSFGVAERQIGESRKDWFRRVDQTMYRAKTNGRNRIELWSCDQKLPSASVKIEWIDNWSSGNELIDRQHKAVLEIGNQLLNLSLSRVPENRINGLVLEVIKEIRQHFHDEEEILRSLSYRELEGHRSIHHKLLDETEILYRKFMADEIDHSVFFHYLVDKIILDHIISEDIRFFPVTRQNCNNPEPQPAPGKSGENR